MVEVTDDRQFDANILIQRVGEKREGTKIKNLKNSILGHSLQRIQRTKKNLVSGVKKFRIRDYIRGNM